MRLVSFLLGACITCTGYAGAPVFDDSENYIHVHGLRHANDEEPIARALPPETTHHSTRAQLHALQQDVQLLRGELEEQAHLIEQLKAQQRSTAAQPAHTVAGRAPVAVVAPPTMMTPHSPVENAKTEITHPTAALTAHDPEIDTVITPPPPSAAHVNPADEQIAYLAAYNLIKAKQYQEALVAMQKLITQYPRGGYTANAEYWVGELYLTKNQPQDALKHFETVVAQYPASSKAAASALKAGYALQAMGQREAARKRLSQVIRHYPDTAAAQLAKAKLSTL